MSIRIRLDQILDDRRVSLTELSEAIDISIVNLSRLKTGNIKAIRFSTLEKICKYLHCKPGDILDIEDEETNREIMDKNV